MAKSPPVRSIADSQFRGGPAGRLHGRVETEHTQPCVAETMRPASSSDRNPAAGQSFSGQNCPARPRIVAMNIQIARCGTFLMRGPPTRIRPDPDPRRNNLAQVEPHAAASRAETRAGETQKGRAHSGIAPRPALESPRRDRAAVLVKTGAPTTALSWPIEPLS